MKHFAFGLAVALTFSHFFRTTEALPMVCAWALYAWLREMQLQREANVFSCEKDCECDCDETLADESDVESVEDPCTVRPMTVPPPLP